jgi:hypothetical protein
VRSALLSRGFLLVVGLSACNALTGVGELSTGPDPGEIVVFPGNEGGSDSQASVVDAEPMPYPHGDASSDEDGSAGDLDASPGEAGADGGTTKRVFVTSTTMTANLGGLIGADLLCSQRAFTAKLGGGGLWRAWLSTPTTNAVTRITGAGPWSLTTGLVAVTRAQLTKAPLTRRIDRDESGVQQTGLVWTGTNSNGTFLDDDCNDWATASTAGHAATGDSKTASDAWTAAVPSGCNAQRRLYCFEL